MGGWIKLWRDIEDTKVLADGKPFDRTHAWIWLLEQAVTETTQARGVKLKRGQLYYSFRYLQGAWHWRSPDTVKTFIDELEAANMITTDRVTYRDGTLITIEKYRVYQGGDNKKRTQDERHTNGTRTNNKKKEEEKKNTHLSPDGEVGSGDKIGGLEW